MSLRFNVVLLTAVAAVVAGAAQSAVGWAAPKVAVFEVAHAAPETGAVAALLAARRAQKKRPAQKQRRRTKTKTRRSRGRVAIANAAIANAAQTPAFEFGNLSLEACLARAEEQHLPLQLVTDESTPGIAIPVRLTGALHGVTFHANSSDAGSPYEILDCRLALALHEFARILASANISEVVHYSMYRPPRGAWAASRLGGQHAGGLAIDVAELVRNDGTRLSVLDDFFGRIGAVTCGPRARPRRKAEATLLLRKLLCETLAEHLFHVVLTPNHNRAHRNHFHMEVMAHTLWFYVE